MIKPIYLDYMATTPVDPRVAKKMSYYLTYDGVFGNENSQHFFGSQAKAAIEDARAQVANLINCDPKSIIWTSGATEANNLCLKGAFLFYKRQGKHIVTCKTEHKSVLGVCKHLETHEDASVTYLTPEPDGLIDLEKFEKNLRRDTILVSIMHVNSEIGVIQNISDISTITREKGILLHVDAAQSLGKIPLDLQKLNVDLMSFSAHKIYGPKGIGALYIRQNPKIHLTPQMHGGNQEHNLRAGTLPTHQIIGMGEACQIARNEMFSDNTRILQLRERLWNGIKPLGNIHINGSLTHRIAGNLSVSFADLNGELLLAALKNIATSSASACSEKIYEPSHVLKAIGLSNEQALNSIRFSVGKFTTEEEIDLAIKHINDVVKKLRSL